MEIVSPTSDIRQRTSLNSPFLFFKSGTQREPDQYYCRLHSPIASVKGPNLKEWSEFY